MASLLSVSSHCLDFDKVVIKSTISWIDQYNKPSRTCQERDHLTRTGLVQYNQPVYTVRLTQKHTKFGISEYLSQTRTHGYPFQVQVGKNHSSQVKLPQDMHNDYGESRDLRRPSAVCFTGGGFIW